MSGLLIPCAQILLDIPSGSLVQAGFVGAVVGVIAVLLAGRRRRG